LRADLILGLGLRALGALSSFALAWIMAQMFGARIVGLYQVGYTTAVLMATIALLGMEVLLVRKVTPLIEAQHWAKAREIFRSTRRFIAISGVILAAGIAILAWPFCVYVMDEPGLAPYLLLLAPVIALMPLARVQNALLRCLGHTALSQSLEGVIYINIAIAGLALIALTVSDPSPFAAPFLIAVGMCISVAIGYTIVQRKTRSWPRSATPLKAEPRAGAAIAAGSIIAQAGNWLILLAITAIMSPADAGIFRVAVLVCMLMQLINSSFATMAGPHLARAAAAGDIDRIRTTIFVAGTIGLAIASPVALVALLLPEPVLGLFGEEFVGGAVALQLLALGQLVNVLAGPVGVALIMQDREQWVLRVEAIATFAGVALAVLLLPASGLAGAALGMLAAALIRNGVNWALVWFHRPPAELT